MSMYSPAYAGSRNNTQVFIDELVMFRARGYQKQYLRPNRTHVNGDVIEEYADAMSYHRTGGLSSEYVSNLTGRFIMPSERPEHINRGGRTEFMDVKIPCGWNEARFVFIMKVRSIRAGFETIELVTGYTDRIDTVSPFHGEEIIAPDTVFTVNSISTLKQTGHISNSMNILGGGMAAEYYHGENALKMTPMNLIHSGTIMSHSGLSDVPDDNNAIVASDFKTIGGAPTAMFRDNNSPTHMASGILNAFSNKYNKMEATGLIDQGDLVASTMDRLADPSIRTSAFMQALYSRNLFAVSTFTFQDLTELDPTIDQRTVTSERFFETSQFTSPWESPTLEAQMALVVSNMVSALMTEFSIAVLDFNSFTISGYGGLDFVNAMRAGSDFETLVTNVNSISTSRDIRPLVGSIEDEINNTICRVLQGNEKMDFTVAVSAKLNKDITVEIAFNGNPVEMFVFPSFADALISPNITTSTKRYNDAARDVNYLISDIHDNLQSRNFDLRPMPNYGATVSDAIPLSTSHSATKQY